MIIEVKLQNQKEKLSMSSVGLRIFSDFKRPDPELVDSFRGIPVANISDCMGRLFAMTSQIQAMGRKQTMLGTALTVKAAIGDNLLFNKAIALAKPGDVIVVDSLGDMNQSVCGDLMYQFAMKKGIAGFVVDGVVRDVKFLREHDFPVYARGVTPRGPYKNGFGEINTDIACGNQVVHPGDIITADEDGVLVIRPADALVLLEKAKAVVEREAGFDKIIAEGKWEQSEGFKMIENQVVKCGFEIY